jgi:hypothetical protein
MRERGMSVDKTNAAKKTNEQDEGDEVGTKLAKA